MLCSKFNFLNQEFDCIFWKKIGSLDEGAQGVPQGAQMGTRWVQQRYSKRSKFYPHPNFFYIPECFMMFWIVHFPGFRLF